MFRKTLPSRKHCNIASLGPRNHAGKVHEWALGVQGKSIGITYHPLGLRAHLLRVVGPPRFQQWSAIDSSYWQTAES